MTDQCAIVVNKLGKRYRLGLAHGRHDTIVDLVASRARNLFSGRKARDEAGTAGSFWALSDVSFKVTKGENVGIIGLNGAGKSTLLKVLSRITYPTTGSADIYGRLGALLEVGTGFHPELTGRENVYLYGAILGMRKWEISKKFDSIIEFAELAKFIDTPVKRYSSGMYVRLAFSVAGHLEPDILVLDEVLAVGDLPFQRKCMELTKQLQQRDATILFVSHNMNSIKTMCQRVIYLKKGQIVFDGSTEEGIGLYQRECQLVSEPTGQGRGAAPITVTKILFLDENNREKSIFNYGESLKLRLTVQANTPVNDPNFIVVFMRSDEVACCNFSSELDGFRFDKIAGDGVLELQTPPLKLTAQSYTIHIIIREQHYGDIIGSQVAGTIHVKDEILDAQHYGVFHEPGKWQWGPVGSRVDLSSALESGQVSMTASEDNL